MCVNLPIEYNIKDMKYLIGFDSNKNEYILFNANKISYH